MATITGRPALPRPAESTTSAAPTTASTPTAGSSRRSHARTTSVPLSATQPQQQGHHRTRSSWLPSFLKPATASPTATLTPSNSTRPTPTPPRRSNSLKSSLRRKVKHLSLSTPLQENTPPAPARPAPPTLLPDADMLDLRLPKAPTNPHHHHSLPYGALPSLAAAQPRPRNCSWDWDGGDHSSAATRKGHTRGAQSLDVGMGGPRLARTRDGRIADLGSIWENFVEEHDEGEEIVFDLPPLRTGEDNQWKASVSSRRVPVPSYIPFPTSVDPLDSSAQFNPDVSTATTSAASYLDLSPFPTPPLNPIPTFADEEEDDSPYLDWNPSAIIPSRQSSLASRRARPIPSPLIIQTEDPNSAFDEATPSPTDSHSVYSRHDDDEEATRHHASYFSPITPNSPYSPYSPFSHHHPSSSSAEPEVASLSISPRSSSPLALPLPPQPRRSPILEHLAIPSSGLLPSPSPTTNTSRHRRHPSWTTKAQLELRTMKTLPLLPLDDEPEGGTSHLSNALPFDHTSFLSPFALGTNNSPFDEIPRHRYAHIPSPATSPRSRPSPAPSPPRIAFDPHSNFTPRDLSSSYSPLSPYDSYDYSEHHHIHHPTSSPQQAPYNPSPQLPSSSTFTATTRFSDDEDGRSVETGESSVLSAFEFDESTEGRGMKQGRSDGEEEREEQGKGGRRSGGEEEREESVAEEEEAEAEAEADSSRVRGEKWMLREFGAEDGRTGGFPQTRSEYGDSASNSDSEVDDVEGAGAAEGEGEDTIRLATHYSRREVHRRSEERRVRYAEERRSLYNEPGPEEAVYVYGVAL